MLVSNKNTEKTIGDTRQSRFTQGSTLFGDAKPDDQETNITQDENTPQESRAKLGIDRMNSMPSRLPNRGRKTKDYLANSRNKTGSLDLKA